MGEDRERSLDHAGLWSNNGGPYADGAVWDVGVQKRNEESIEWYRFDFLVLCIGRYGNLPYIPSLPPNKGPEVFQGKVLHTMDYSGLDEKDAYELIKGKRVVVIGLQKSALDFAAECAEANRDGHPCTVVFRRAHWGIITYELFGLPLQLFYNTRFAQFLLERPAQGFLLTVLSRLLRPLRWIIFKLLEFYLCWKLPLQKHGLVPDHSFVEELASCNTSTYPANLFPRAEEGCVHFRKSSNWSFSSKGIVLDDGTEVKADIVVFATGYDAEKKLKSLLPEPFADVLEKTAGVVPLYRGTIHPHIPHMAIIGYSESLANLYSSEIRAQWLSHFLSGKFVLPSLKEMETDAENYYNHWMRVSPFYWKPCHAAFQIWDNDNLCRDMGWNPMRKKNWFYELFAPYSNLDYREM